MHAAVIEFIQEQVARFGPFDRVVEIGSRDINGAVRHLFAAREYVGIDLAPGPGVDLVMDAAEFQGSGFDAVVSCETFEHARGWRELVAVASRALNPGGVCLMTCASGERHRHSGIDEAPIRDDEFYANVEPEEARSVFERWFASVEVRTVRDGLDLQVVARKGTE